MKPNFEFIPNLNASFFTYQLSQPSFEFLWHYHPEYEVTYVVKGKGRRLIGDNEEHFKEGDLVLIGSNIPHGYFSKSIEGGIKAIGIQFSPGLINSDVLGKEDFLNIHKLLESGKNGLVFSAQSTAELIPRLNKIHSLKGIQKYIALIELLDAMGSCEDSRHLLERPHEVIGKSRNNPLDAALKFIHDNLEKPINIDELARQTNMTRTSFCRFFRKKTGTTFSNYLSELRIGRVCLELVTSDDRISTVAFKSGFNSLTHFNRIFREKKRVSPSTYRKHFGNVPEG